MYQKKILTYIFALLIVLSGAWADAATRRSSRSGSRRASVSRPATRSASSSRATRSVSRPSSTRSVSRSSPARSVSRSPSTRSVSRSSPARSVSRPVSRSSVSRTPARAISRSSSSHRGSPSSVRRSSSNIVRSSPRVVRTSPRVVTRSSSHRPVIRSSPRVVTRHLPAPRRVVQHRSVRVYSDYNRHSSFGLHLNLGSHFSFGYRYHHPRPIIRIYGHYPIDYPSYHHYYYGSYYPYPTTRVYVASPTVYVDRPVVVEEVPIYISPRQKFIGQVLRDDEPTRAKAARGLALYKDISTVAVLVDVLINDASAEVRVAAADSLAQIADPAAYPALIRSAAAEQEDKVRLASQSAADIIAARSDGKLYLSPKMPPMNDGNPKLGEYLEDLRYGSHKEREHATEKLDDHRGTQSAAALINVLLNDPIDEVREEAAQSLGKIGDRMALPFLKYARSNDTDKSVREDAEKAIEKIHYTIQ